MDTALDLILKKVGKKADLARLMNVKPQAITKWRDEIPVKRVLELERLTGVPRHRLCPKFYPVKRQS
jgi:DNA-binding transcriptional regulator YdaS (Cro superfamily)